MKLCPVEIHGSSWDEVGNREVAQILISYDVTKIHSIQFAYAETTGLRHSQIYGQPTGRNFKSVVFEYPSEFITSVSGKYAEESVGRFHRLFSITFVTNRRTYGPFGTAAMVFDDLVDYYDMLEVPVTEFKYEFGARDFGGFHGSVFNSYICCIGVHVKPLQTLNSTST